MKDFLSKYKREALLVIGIIVSEILNNFYGEKTISLQTFIYALANILQCMFYIVMMVKPIKAIMILVVSNLLYIINNTITGGNLSIAISNQSGVILLLVIALVVHIIIADIKIYRNNNADNKYFKRFIDDINIIREPYKVNIIARLIIAVNFITVIACVSKSVSNNSNTVSQNLYIASIVVLPVIILIANLTTSIIAYDLLIIQTLVNIASSIYLIKLNRFNICNVYSSLIDLYLCTLCLVKLKKIYSNTNKYTNK